METLNELKTLVAVLTIMVYVLLAILSYKPFSKISRNGWSEFPLPQSLLFPFVWTLLILISIAEGFKILLTQNLKTKNNGTES